MASQEPTLHPAVSMQPMAPVRQRRFIQQAIDALTAEPFTHRAFPDMLERWLPGRSGMALHVFSTRLVRRRDWDTNSIHIHLGHIRSHVLLGTLVNRIFADDECRTWTDVEHGAGQTWTTDAPIIHRTYAGSDLVVTLFREDAGGAEAENYNIDPDECEPFEELECDLRELTRDVLIALHNRLTELEEAAGRRGGDAGRHAHAPRREPWQDTAFQPGPAHDDSYAHTVRRRAAPGHPNAVWIRSTFFGNRVEAGNTRDVQATYCCGDDATYLRVVYEALIRALDHGHGPDALPRQEVLPLWNDQPCLKALLSLAGMEFAYEGLVRHRPPDRSDARAIAATTV